MAKEYIEREAILRNLADDLPYKGSVKRVLMQAPVADVVEVKHGKWESYLECGEEADDGYDHHRCSECKCMAEFTYVNEPFYDENSDGEIEFCGNYTVDINENLTNYCPNCGAKMDGGKE